MPSSITIFALIGMFGLFGIAQQQKRLARGFATLAMLAAMLVTSSCAGTVGPKPPPNATSYTVTVTAAAINGPTHTQAFTLTVTQ